MKPKSTVRLERLFAYVAGSAVVVVHDRPVSYVPASPRAAGLGGGLAALVDVRRVRVTVDDAQPPEEATPLSSLSDVGVRGRRRPWSRSGPPGSSRLCPSMGCAPRSRPRRGSRTRTRRSRRWSRWRATVVKTVSAAANSCTSTPAIPGSLLVAMPLFSSAATIRACRRCRATPGCRAVDGHVDEAEVDAEFGVGVLVLVHTDAGVGRGLRRARHPSGSRRSRPWRRRPRWE